MKIEVNMTTNTEMFEVVQWWAKSPDFVLKSLRAQLEAAATIWPELKGYEIIKRGKSSKRTAGEAGGHARADALSPERRSEIASDAAKARWGHKEAV